MTTSPEFSDHSYLTSDRIFALLVSRVVPLPLLLLPVSGSDKESVETEVEVGDSLSM